MNVLSFQFDHVAERLHELEDEDVAEYPNVPDYLLEDFKVFLTVMQAKDIQELADIPVNNILNLFDKLDSLIPYLNLDNNYTMNSLSNNLRNLKLAKKARRIL